MLHVNKLRRSALFMPASNMRALEKAKSLATDVILMDLEDAVSSDKKELARNQAIEAIAVGGYGSRELVIRINGKDTQWYREDIQRVACSGADAVLLSKVEAPGDVQNAEAELVSAGAPSNLAIWCMIETPKGVLRVSEIAGASDRVAVLVLGTSDLTKDLRVRPNSNRLPLITSLGICVLAARSHGLDILDGVHLDLEDISGFEIVCRQGADFGFDGKTLIHPKTLEFTNKIFGPSNADIAWSRRILNEYNLAKQNGEGVIVVDGKLVESLHVEQARRIINLAELIKASDDELKTKVL